MAKIARYQMPDGRIARFEVPDTMDIEAPASEAPLSGGDKALGVLQGILQGGTLGFSDELEQLAAGGGGFVGALAAGADNPMQVAREVMQESGPMLREKQAAFAKQEPTLDVVSELLGGIAGPASIKGAKYIMQGAGALPRIGRSIVVGGSTGAASGLGSSEDNRGVSNALGGGVLGAIMGGGLGAAGETAGPALGKLAQKLSGIATRSGQGVVQGRAARKLLQNMQRDNMGPSDIAKALRDLGEGGTIADVGGPSVRGLSSALVTSPGEARTLAEQSMGEARRSGMAERLLEAASRNLGGVKGDVGKATDELIAARSRAAQPLYESAYATQVDPQAMVPVLNDPYLRDMFQQVQANKLYGLKGEGSNSIAVIDAVKKNLDDMIESAKRAGENNKARVLMEKKNTLVGLADEAVPAYAEARAAWEGPSKLINAMEQGRGFMKGDIEDLQGALAKMPESEREFFRQGVMRELRGQVEKSREGLSSVRTRLGTPEAKKRFAEAFPSQQNADDFIRAIEAENTKQAAANEILRGSQTAQRQAGQADLAGDSSGYIERLLRGDFRGAAISKGADLVQGVVKGIAQMPEASRNQLAKMLFSNDRTMQANAIKALRLTVKNDLDLQKMVDQIRRGLIVASTPVGQVASGSLTNEGF